MPITYEIDSTRNLIRTTCFGQVRLPDVIAHFDALQRDPSRPDRLDVLLDLREMAAPPEAPQLQAVADRVGLMEGLVFGACAIVANKESMFGMMRMFEVLARPYFAALKTFRDVASAEEWLESF
jgi:hypothetical protein